MTLTGEDWSHRRGLVTQGNDSAIGKRVTTEVFVEGKRKRFSQSIQWQTKLHCEKHLLTNTAGSSMRNLTRLHCIGGTSSLETLIMPQGQVEP